MAKHTHTKRGSRSNEDTSALWVASALPGLEDLLREEIDRKFKGQAALTRHTRTSECHFRFKGRPQALLSLRLCHSLYLRRDFAVIRPRGLLSPENIVLMVRDISSVMSITPADQYTGLRWEAAGSNSPTMQRLGLKLAEELGIPFSNDTGDLVITLRPGPDKKGWEVLYRVGNRPLGTRAWRKVDYRGSLSGTIAAALVELSSPSRRDRFLNLMCGSGTIMIERLKRVAARATVGVDNSAAALIAAQQNCAAAGLSGQILLVKGDARRLPFEDRSFNKLCVDLQWGESIGTRASNASLYRGTFEESYRLCLPGGKLVVLTQDHRALEALPTDVESRWELLDKRTFVQRGFKPQCRVYRKRGE